MTDLILTHHAKRRFRQRAIPQEAIDFLMRFGSSARSHGAERIFFDKAARRRIERELPADAWRKCTRYINTYLVLGDSGSIVTAGYRTKRFRKH